MSNKYYVAFPKEESQELLSILAAANCEVLTQYVNLPTIFEIETTDTSLLPVDVLLLSIEETSISFEQANWHLHRIVNPYLPLRNTYDPLATGKDVTTYVIDSGFENVPAEELFYSHDNDFTDKQDHGTKIRNLIKQVSPDTNLKLLRIPFDDIANLLASLIAGFDKILGDVTTTSVVNMSWVMDTHPLLDYLISYVFASDKLVGVCSGGNNGLDVAELIPAGNPSVYTVGASDKYDRVIKQSGGEQVNNGEELNFFAPGVDIGVIGKDGPSTDSGTSFSAAIASGVVAQFVETASSTEEALDNFVGSLNTDTLYLDSSKLEYTHNKLVYTPNKFNFNVWNTPTGLIGEYSASTGVQVFAFDIDEHSGTISGSDFADIPPFVTIEDNELRIDTDQNPDYGLYNISLVAEINGEQYIRLYNFSIDQDISTENPVEYYYDTSSGTGEYISVAWATVSSRTNKH